MQVHCISVSEHIWVGGSGPRGVGELPAGGIRASQGTFSSFGFDLVTCIICFLPTDVGSNNSGYYELQAVLTHKGRSSSSGHYVAWVRRKGDDWLMFDDENVTGVTSEDVLKLSGGGGL